MQLLIAVKEDSKLEILKRKYMKILKIYRTKLNKYIYNNN